MNKRTFLKTLLSIPIIGRILDADPISFIKEQTRQKPARLFIERPDLSQIELPSVDIPLAMSRASDGDIVVLTGGPFIIQDVEFVFPRGVRFEMRDARDIIMRRCFMDNSANGEEWRYDSFVSSRRIEISNCISV